MFNLTITTKFLRYLKGRSANYGHDEVPIVDDSSNNGREVWDGQTERAVGDQSASQGRLSSRYRRFNQM